MAVSTIKNRVMDIAHGGTGATGVSVVSNVSITSTDSRLSLTSAYVRRWGKVIFATITLNVNGTWQPKYAGRIEFAFAGLPVPATTLTAYSSWGDNAPAKITLWNTLIADLRLTGASAITQDAPLMFTLTYLEA